MQKAYSAVAAGFEAYSDVIPSRGSELTQSVAIVGAGAVGLGTAWHLASRVMRSVCLTAAGTSRF